MQGEYFMRNRNIFRRYLQRKIYSISILLSILLCLLFLSACDSSDTRSTTKSSTSSATELQIRIQSPVDGATVAYTTATGGTTTSTQVFFTTGIPLGGTLPYTVTFLSKGPNTSNSATAFEDPATKRWQAQPAFRETGIHTITAVLVDSRGFTVSDSIRISVELDTRIAPTTTTVSTTTTSTTSTSTTTGTTTST